MTAAILVLIVLAACLLVPVIVRAQRRWRDRPDPAWRASRRVMTYPGHDQTRAKIAARRAETADADRLRSAVKRAGESSRRTRRADVIVMPRRGQR